MADGVPGRTMAAIPDLVADSLDVRYKQAVRSERGAIIVALLTSQVSHQASHILGDISTLRQI